MDRKDFFFRQRVTQAELDAAWDDAENADRLMVAEIMGVGFLITGPEPATVVENTAPDSNVLANVFLGYDQLGERVSNFRSGFQGGVDLGLPAQVVDMLVDEVAAATTVATPGNEKTLAIFVEFRRKEFDPRLDGNGATVFHEQQESIQFNVVQSAEAALGTSVPPPLRSDQLLLADVTRIFAQTTFLNADIDQSRREAFSLKLTHGGTHVETGTDPVPNATGSVGGLLSAVDKTRFDILPETAADVAALFDNQLRDFQPANATAPSAATLDVTALFIAQTPGGSASVEGFATTAPENLGILRRVNGDDFLESISGDQNKIQGRLTEAASVWTLSFFYLDEATGAEIAFDMTPFTGTAIVWFVQRAYSLENLPISNPARTIPSDQMAAEVPVATTTAPGRVLSAIGAPATPVAGVVNSAQNNGVEVGGGNAPYYRLNFLGSGLSSPAAGILDIAAAAGFGKIVQVVTVQLSAFVGTATTVPFDDTIPTSSEGAQWTTIGITPTNAGSILLFRVNLIMATDGDNHNSAWLLDNSNVTKAAGIQHSSTTDRHQSLSFAHSQSAGGTTLQTWKVRFGSNAGFCRINGRNNATPRLYGGVMSSSIQIWEILP